MLEGKKIILGITGSIAAYKSIYLLRQLTKAGAEVKVIVTPAAKDFVPVLTLSTLSRNPVLVDLFDEASWSNHVMLGRWADVLLIAPASCNTIAKMANGQCDNLLLATWLSATCPTIVTPAMDEDMWHHPATKSNLKKLESFGNKIIPVTKGDLASGLHGDGRMAEPESILDFLNSEFFGPKPLSGKKALVTAGPTYEPLDPVRFIGNHSSGKMGIALAYELQQQGAEVTLVLGPVQVPVPGGMAVQRVQTAAEMHAACMTIFHNMDLAILAAAVADYSPVEVSPEKIKKNTDHFTIELTKTPDILQTMGEAKRDNQVIVGFALETTNGDAYAKKKLERKNADMIVLNSLQDPGAGFGYDTNTISIYPKNGDVLHFENKSKKEVAKDIVDTITRLHYV